MFKINLNLSLLSFFKAFGFCPLTSLFLAHSFKESISFIFNLFRTLLSLSCHRAATHVSSFQSLAHSLHKTPGCTPVLPNLELRSPSLAFLVAGHRPQVCLACCFELQQSLPFQIQIQIAILSALSEAPSPW